MPSRRSVLAALVAGAGGALAGCSFESSDGESPTPGGDTPAKQPLTSTATVTPTATLTSTGTPTSTEPATPTATPSPVPTTAEPSRTATAPAPTDASTPVPTATAERGEQVAEVTETAAEEYDDFGSTVVASGDRLFVTAPGDSHEDTGAEGTVFEFGRVDGEWTRQATLRPTGDALPFEYTFGVDIAVADGTLVVGALERVGPHRIPRGGAVVFERSDGWERAATLRADRAADDVSEAFGGTVAVDGDAVLVGAHWAAADGDDVTPGATYAFTRSGGNGDTATDSSGTDRSSDEWSQSARLVASDAVDHSDFGRAIALDGETAVIGAPGYQRSNGDDVGKAYVFERTDGEWEQRASLTPAVNYDPDDEDYFGSSVALEGSTALVGAWGDDDPNGFYAGAVYAFERIDGEWAPDTRLATADGDREDVFGSDVALWGDRALVGAEHDEDPNGDNAGSAYLFGRDDDGEWRQTVKLLPEEGNGSDLFGTSVALSTRNAFISTLHGDEADEGPGAGTVCVFST